MNKYTRGRYLLVTSMFFVMGSNLATQVRQGDHEYFFITNQRSYHVPVHDAVLEQEHSPFGFSACALSNAIRLASYLVGEVHAATYDQQVYDHMVSSLEYFSYRVLDLYALYYQAYHEVLYHVTTMPEKETYLFGEMAHLQERISKFRHIFFDLMGTAHNEYVDTIQVTCQRMSKKTEQLLSPDF